MLSSRTLRCFIVFIISVEKILLRLLVLFVNEITSSLQHRLRINKTHINQISFPHHSTLKAFAKEPFKTVYLNSFIDCNKVTLKFWDNSGHCSKEWRKHFFVAISSVDWFSCFTHDKKMLSDLVEFSKILIYLYVALQRGINLL